MSKKHKFCTQISHLKLKVFFHIWLNLIWHSLLFAENACGSLIIVVINFISFFCVCVSMIHTRSVMKISLKVTVNFFFSALNDSRISSVLFSYFKTFLSIDSWDGWCEVFCGVLLMDIDGDEHDFRDFWTVNCWMSRWFWWKWCR